MGADKLAYYDGLRGLAALWVFFRHYLSEVSWRHKDLMHGYQPRTASVPLFFILSGRVLAVSIMRSGSTKKLVSAIIRRPIRLLIPIWMMMLVDILFLHHFKFKSYTRPFTSILWFMFDNARVPRDISFNTIWTLRIEYIYSNAVFFITFVLLQFQGSARVRYMVMAIVFMWFELTHQWGTHFVAGLFMADLAHHGQITRYRAWKYSSYATALIFFASVVVSFRLPYWNIAGPIEEFVRSHQFWRGKQGVGNAYNDENSVFFLFCFATMFCIETSSWLQYFFSLPPFRFLGDISFTLYLLHYYLIKMFGKQFVAMVKKSVSNKHEAFVVYLTVMTVVVTYCSYVLTPLVDEPSVHLGRWLERVAFHESWSMSAMRSWLIAAPGGAFRWIWTTLIEMTRRATLGLLSHCIDWTAIKQVTIPYLSSITSTTVFNTLHHIDLRQTPSHIKTFINTNFPVIAVVENRRSANGFEPIPTTDCNAV